MPFAAGDLAAVTGAVVLAAAGGEAFLKAILSAAKQLRVPSAVAATTLAAFATSSPELTVSTVAALSGHPEIGLGDALGSNVVNIALIFGLALLFGPIRSSDEFGRDYLLALAVPLATALTVLDGSIERWEGFVLLAVFAGWIGWVLRTTLRRRDMATSATVSPGLGPWATLALGVAGLAALVAAGRLFVLGATGIATSFAIDAYVIGVLVVAVGTSLPELVTVLLARLRGHEEVGVGTLIGSNLFNGLAIVGTAASIHPIAVPAREAVVTLVWGLAALLLLLPNRVGLIARGRGVVLLALYGGFVWTSLGAAS
ncbi:MAG: sodium:calcium antiporter [Rhodocyclaceae bacterium]|nr:sodium:calcium antiporter [Rhodocyclaceae bacterium]